MAEKYFKTNVGSIKKGDKIKFGNEKYEVGTVNISARSRIAKFVAYPDNKEKVVILTIPVTVTVEILDN